MPKLTKITSRISRDLWLSAAVAVVIIAAGFFLGYTNNHVITKFPTPGFHYLQEPQNPLSYMSNWDGPDYIYIAGHGYPTDFWINWFPMYPLAIAAVHLAVPSLLDSALLVAWLSLIGAIFFYIKIVRHLFKIKDQYEPLRALIFFILFPTGVFLIAPFSESLYAMLALGSIYFALKKNWQWAALFGLFCTATHITGPAVVVLVGLILLEEKLPLKKVILTVLISGMGLVTYMAYLYSHFDNPLGFLASQQIYHGWTSAQHSYLNLIASAGFSSSGLVALIIVAAVYWWHRRRSFAVYSLLYLLIPLVGRQFSGFDRYALMIFPVQFMLYEYFRDKKIWYPYVTALAGIMWAYFLLQYAGGYIGS